MYPKWDEKGSSSSLIHLADEANMNREMAGQGEARCEPHRKEGMKVPFSEEEGLYEDVGKYEQGRVV